MSFAPMLVRELGGWMMSDSEEGFLNVSRKIVRDAEWILIIYQSEGDRLPTFKLIHSPHFFQRRTQFRHAEEKIEY